jgi:hypothetical protein
MTFPDDLPELSAIERDRVNEALLARLAEILGWVRAQA